MKKGLIKIRNDVGSGVPPLVSASVCCFCFSPCVERAGRYHRGVAFTTHEPARDDEKSSARNELKERERESFFGEEGFGKKTVVRRKEKEAFTSLAKERARGCNESKAASSSPFVDRCQDV